MQFSNETCALKQEVLSIVVNEMRLSQLLYIINNSLFFSVIICSDLLYCFCSDAFPLIGNTFVF